MYKSALGKWGIGSVVDSLRDTVGGTWQERFMSIDWDMDICSPLGLPKRDAL